MCDIIFNYFLPKQVAFDLDLGIIEDENNFFNQALWTCLDGIKDSTSFNFVSFTGFKYLWMLGIWVKKYFYSVQTTWSISFPYLLVNHWSKYLNEFQRCDRVSVIACWITPIKPVLLHTHYQLEHNMIKYQWPSGHYAKKEKETSKGFKLFYHILPMSC